MTIRRIRRRIREGHFEFTSHALEEMDDDELTDAEVIEILLNGDLVATLDDDTRGPRHVVRGAVADDGVPIEIVCRLMPTGVLRIVTVYAVEH